MEVEVFMALVVVVMRVLVWCLAAAISPGAAKIWVARKAVMRARMEGR